MVLLTLMLLHIVALGGVEYSGDASVNGIATLTALANPIWGGYAVVSCNASIIANGRIVGEGWTPVSYDTNTWTAPSVGTNTWTDVSVGSNTWDEQTAGSNTWTDVSFNDNDWLRQG